MWQVLLLPMDDVLGVFCPFIRYLVQSFYSTGAPEPSQALVVAETMAQACAVVLQQAVLTRLQELLDHVVFRYVCEYSTCVRGVSR